MCSLPQVPLPYFFLVNCFESWKGIWFCIRILYQFIKHIGLGLKLGLIHQFLLKDPWWEAEAITEEKRFPAAALP